MWICGGKHLLIAVTVNHWLSVHFNLQELLARDRMPMTPEWQDLL